MFLEIIIENNDSETPSVEDLGEWADNYGLTMPVLADEGESVLYSYATGSIGLPYTVLLDRGVVVDSVGSASVGEMDDLLAE
jgi:peroxiredoxin